MSDITFLNSILSSSVTLFADNSGFASSPRSTLLTAAAQLEVGSIFIQTEGRCQELNYPHCFLEHFSFPWRFPIQVLTKPVWFAYKIWKGHSLRWKNYWKMLSLLSGTWLGQELGVQNLDKSLCFCGNVNTTSTFHHIPPSWSSFLKASRKIAVLSFATVHFYSLKRFLNVRCQLSPCEVSVRSYDVQIQGVRIAGRL